MCHPSHVEQPAPPGMLRIMTLNSWFRSPLPTRAAEIRSWIEATAPHVICLQEIQRHDDLAQTLADQLASDLPGTWHVVFAGFPARLGGLIGNAILSRWPIQGSQALRLPGEDALPKSVLHARTAGIDVCCIHLASAPDGAGIRERQAVMIDEFARDRAAGNSPLPPILAGDFNATPGASAIRFLRGEQTLHGKSTFYQDAWAAAGDGTPGHTWTSRNPHTPPAHLFDARCDYIFAGVPHAPLGWSTGHNPTVPPAGQITSAALLCTYPKTGIMASDHYGLAADICWPDLPPPT